MRLPSSIIVLILSLLVLQQGCTTSPLESPKPRWALPEDEQAKIRTIGIVVSEELPRVTLDLPSKGAAAGASRKAGIWSGDWVMSAGDVMRSGLNPGGGAGSELLTSTAGAMLVVTPVVAAAGAVKGAIEAPSAEAVESQEAQVRGILQAEYLIHRLQNQVLTQVRDRTDVVATILPQNAWDQASHRETTSTSGVPQPDTMLMIQLILIDLRGKFDIDPPLALNVEARVTLTGTSAPTLPHTDFRYVSEARPLTEWTADDAKVFREAVDLSLARLAEWIVDALFLTHPVVHEQQR